MKFTSGKETIINPVTGEKLLVLKSTREVFKMAFSINPRSRIAADHVHPRQEQTIEVTAGELHCRVDGQNHILRAGDWITIPAGADHYQWNPTDKEALAIEKYQPAGQIHNFFRILFLLAEEGQTNGKGVPKPLVGAALMAEFKDTVRASSIFLRLLFGLLAPLSGLLGYRRTIRDRIEKFEAADDRAALSKSIHRIAPVTEP